MELAKRLSGRLERLDADLITMLEHFELRERGRIQALLAAAAGDAATPPPTQAKAKSMIDLLDAVKLKPERGRTRDLVAIHSLLKKLEAMWLEG